MKNLAILFLGFFACISTANAQTKISSATYGAIEARCIGPAVMGGRITAIDGVNSSPKTLYVGTAGGGVWKSTTAGMTYEPIFEKYPQSIGALAIDQNRPETIWVGTGESNMRNSVAVGLGLTYYTIAGFINTTTITVDRGSLRLRHFPLPWLYSGTIATHEIDQIFCKETVQTNKGTAWYRYAVSVLLKNGRERKLIANLDAPEVALYLEAEIEKYLGITDRAVAGEYKG